MPEVEFFVSSSGHCQFIYDYVPMHQDYSSMRGECLGYLMDLNFSFDHYFLIGGILGVLKRDLIKDSFLLQAG